MINKIIINGSDAAIRLVSLLGKLVDTVGELDFEWCNEPFDVYVSMPTKENRGTSNLNLKGLVVLCENNHGYFGFDLI